MASYLHQVPGRIRLRAPSFKDDAACRARAFRALRALRGVHAVAASPTTGSVTVHFDEALVCPSTIIDTLADCGALQNLVGFPRLAAVSGGGAPVPVRALGTVLPLRPVIVTVEAAPVLPPLMRKALLVGVQLAGPILLERAFGKAGRLAARILF